MTSDMRALRSEDLSELDVVCEFRSKKTRISEVTNNKKPPVGGLRVIQKLLSVAFTKRSERMLYWPLPSCGHSLVS